MSSCRRLGAMVAVFVLTAGVGRAAPAGEAEEIYPGVWRITFGAPEAITPVKTRHYAPAADGLAALPKVAACPVDVTATSSGRGVLVNVPLAGGEMIYGLGLQFQSFQQRGLKKKLRVNADSLVDSGDSHAPVPFYVTTRGYGVLIDTARYATFNLGIKHRKRPSSGAPAPVADKRGGWNEAAEPTKAGTGTPDAVQVEIPEAGGVDVYVFGGPDLRGAVQRYNLFSGGGPLPPRWGLGFWYRGQADFSQADVMKLAGEFRERHLPFDVFGLEPHWQTHAYSCSYVWDSSFPSPAEMLAKLSAMHFRLNLWEHAFVHPTSPIYSPLQAHAGDYQVWGGLVPDFLQPETRGIFADFHRITHAALGVSGYKGDECDNSDFTGNWSFPEISRFPSGADGEQMHTLFGLRYQDALTEVFDQRSERTYGLVRSSGALAAPYPYALYSDLYDHRQYVRALAQSGFSGLLWTPEVRDSLEPAELIRRLQTVVFSPLAGVNAWYLRHPPWKQVNRAENNAGKFAPNWEATEAQCRDLFFLRMRFVPLIQAAFVRYHREGLPPFRALVMDYPKDAPSQTNDDEFLVGDSLLVAPVIVPPRNGPRPAHAETNNADGSIKRRVYLPPGEWFDFWTGEARQGGKTFNLTVPLEQIPLFVKSGAILPLAQPTESTADPESWKLTARVFGDGHSPAVLYEDDGAYHPSLNSVTLTWDAGQKTGAVSRQGGPGAMAYEVVKWIPPGTPFAAGTEKH